MGRMMASGRAPVAAAPYRGAIAQRICRPVQHTSSAPAKCSSVLRTGARGSVRGRYMRSLARFAWYGSSNVHEPPADAAVDEKGANALYRPAIPHMSKVLSGCMRAYSASGVPGMLQALVAKKWSAPLFRRKACEA